MQMTCLDGITFMAIDVKPKLGIRTRVKERLESALCLHCDDEAERLGCCTLHYQRFRTEMNKLPLSERELFKARQIREGKIAPSRQGQRVDLKNEFAE